MFKVVKQQIEHGGNTLLRNITVCPPSSEKSKKSPNTLKNGTVHSSELLGVLYQSTWRFTPQDWNILVRICSTVLVVSSLMREPIRVSTLLAEFANGRLQSITRSVTFPSWMKTESLHEPVTGFNLEPTKSSWLRYIFCVTSEFTLSHMRGCCPKLIFSKISCAFLTSFTSFISVSVTFVTWRFFFVVGHPLKILLQLFRNVQTGFWKSHPSAVYSVATGATFPVA